MTRYLDVNFPRLAPRRQVFASKGSVAMSREKRTTIIEALTANGTSRPDSVAMRYCPGGRSVEDDWQVLSWADYLLGARQVAGGLAELGIGPGERVAILSANRVEWHLADLGILSNASVTVPVYPTSSPSQIAYILDHAEATVCFVDTHAQLGKLLSVRDRLPALKRLVLSEGPRTRW